uniref:Putative abc transporter c family member n=1 Tax=Corethrella appendiculata TaxID=1370023 RepID=W4VRR2_9DIPT
MEFETPRIQAVSPRKKANILSYITFWWVLPIFFKGYRKDLDLEDLYQSLDEHKSGILGNKLAISWKHELKIKKAEQKEPNLLKAVLNVFGWSIMMLGIILLSLEIFLKISQPLFLGKLIQYYSKNNGNVNDAYLYAAAIVLCSALNVLFMHPYMLSNLHMGMKIRVAFCSMIYRKAVALKQTVNQELTVGQLVNLLSNDVGRLDLSIIFLHYLWVGPLETIIITYLMYTEIGISAFFGVLFLLMFIPLQAYLGKKTSILRLKTALRTDERVRLMNEIVQGIQVIKMYTWEKPFSKLVSLTRKKEIQVIRYVSYIRGILLSFIMFTTRVSIFISLVVFAVLGNVVTAEKAFVITSYYNILRATMTIFFPQGISQLAETLTSINRIQKFMMYEEVDKNADNSIQSKLNENLIDGIVFDSLTAKWCYNLSSCTLENINLKIEKGSLLAVIGPVGSGKSSFIQAILGNLPILSGNIVCNGKLSYASQQPWIFSSTIRQNILFGEPMNRERYKKVIKVCALERDFTLFKNADKTIVGDRGQSLSGGQKARINLARAVYREADIYLLDDPLSAVDTHVGSHLFEQCLKLFLKEKVVILVTHQLQYLQHADKIIILENGKVEAIGTYRTLCETGLDFAKLLTMSSEDGSDIDLETNSHSVHSRQNSDLSVDLTNSSDNLEHQVNKEAKSEGTIDFKVYKSYFDATGGFSIVAIILLFFICAQLLASCGDYFLSYWVNKEENRYTADADANSTINSLLSNDDIKRREVTDDIYTFLKKIENILEAIEADKYFDVYIFTSLVVSTVIITIIRSFLFFSAAMKASRNLHDSMFEGVTKATMYFFNTNPSGRILNRFSKDMGQIDEILPSVMIDVVQIFLSLFGIIAVVAIVNYYYLIPTLIIAVIFYFLRGFYLKSARSIKRLEAITRSPIYSHLAATLTGLTTIQAFGAENVLIDEFDNHQDLNSSAFYLFISTSRAFGFWLDVFCVIYIAIVTLSFFIMNNSGGNVGLAITQALGMTGMVQWGMRQSAELENTMTAVERVVEYNSIDQEVGLNTEINKNSSTEWPQNGAISFDNLSLRYNPNTNNEYILRDLQINIKGTEKIGVVGRTGAGKTSIIIALFRLAINEGNIFIDDADISTVNLQHLRSKISIIPQEPVLFSGTLRFNLDPFNEYTDEKIWQALQKVKLNDSVGELPSGLHSKISEGGSNFSVGERQLICLARALLRENIILIMDEATANVDPQTDKLIQATVKEKFSHCTVLTIAHRLHTIMDSDKVIVMDAGRCVEFGTPYDLLNSEVGPKIFQGMVKQTGKATYESLKLIAENVNKTRQAQEN